MKVLTVLGARPQFIKASVVSAEFARRSIPEVVVHTGQHYDANMSEVFFEDLGMSSPAYHLGIGGGSHAKMTGRMLEEIEKVLLQECPDVVLVYGDTNSTLAGALASVKMHIPVAHVEAGLRSFNMRMPEEVNRILSDRISNWLFTPTSSAADHLRQEGVEESKIVPVGDVMYDVAISHGLRAASRSGLLDRLNMTRHGYVLVTVHRAENTDDVARLGAIIDGLLRVAKRVPVLWPLHPRTRRALEASDNYERLANHVALIDPVGYLDMVQLEMNAALIATDSGGVQKEAFFHRIPCVTLRDETEWVELVSAGWNQLVPPVSGEAIDEAIDGMVGKKGADIEPYGRGDAARRIVDRLVCDRSK